MSESNADAFKSAIDLAKRPKRGHSGDSPYTSWTRSPDIARQFAKEDGLILRVKIGAPKEGDKWSWQFSEDRWGEQEVLLKGPRSGDIEVFKP